MVKCDMISHSSEPDCGYVRLVPGPRDIVTFWTPNPKRAGVTITQIAQRFKERDLPSARVFYRLTRDSPEYEYLSRPCPTRC